MQLDHYNTNFTKRNFPIVLVCDHVTNAPNIGSLFRTADAFGIEKLIFCGNPSPIGRKMAKTSRSTEKTMNFEVSESVSESVETLKSEGYQIIALEITSNSVPMHTFTLSDKRPIALVIGDESFGVSEKILERSDAIIHIDMFGQNSSMNVVQATSIALYEITKQLS